MSETLIYIVTDGERWYTISQKAYGRPDLFPSILAANPSIPFSARLEGGTQLQIPVLVTTDAAIDISLLPPWKQ